MIQTCMCPLYKENKSLESKSSACKVKIFYREKKTYKKKRKIEGHEKKPKSTSSIIYEAF